MAPTSVGLRTDVNPPLDDVALATFGRAVLEAAE
jgi:hypothetical protein